MIRFSLNCADGHAFDAWFASGAAFDALSSSGRVTCPVCESAAVTKALMAPRVTAGKAVVDAPGPSPREAALRALKTKVEAGSDYVGRGFAAEARRIHLGDAKQRSIYGEARPEEARALIEDGVPILPLPFMPARKVN